MACYSPLHAKYGKVLRSGKREIVFSPKGSVASLEIFPLKLPCGQCIGCRLERSRQWAMRCLHEASLHDSNWFLTCTFDRDHLPEDGSLSVRTLQLFLKRLRKKFGSGVRFFACGEYGERYGRPHYHMCVFNCRISDLQLFSIKNGNKLFTSETVTKLWGQGFVGIGEVTFESAAYVARYVMKKVNGALKEKVDKNGLTHYERVDGDTGEVYELRPEFVTMSRGSKILGTGGIGRDWYKKFKGDIFPHDYAIVRGVKVKPPRYYEGLYEREDPEGFRSLKQRRFSAPRVRRVKTWNSQLQKFQMVDEYGDERLAVKEAVAKSRLTQFKRSLEG